MRRDKARKRNAAKTRPEAGATPSRRKIAARSLRASGVTPASCCWKAQLVFWPRTSREFPQLCKTACQTNSKRGTRRNMAIIKAPPKQPKSVTIQARVEEADENSTRPIRRIHRLHSVLRDYRSPESPLQSRQGIQVLAGQHVGNADEDAPAAHHA